jgi:hypothetical protein
VEMRIWIRDANLRQKVQYTYIIYVSRWLPTLRALPRVAEKADALVGKSLSAGGRLSP